MSDLNKDFAEVVKFHGHACPGLAFGFRATGLALEKLGISRAGDEELVAVVENKSCAVDAIQAMAGCTFGKGNLIFKDYGKQVYTLFNRSTGEAVRLAVIWETSAESEKTREAWQSFRAGERSPEIMALVEIAKKTKLEEILAAPDRKLFKVTTPKLDPPAPARIYQSLTCRRCGEKVMEPRAEPGADGPLCIPCNARQEHLS
ncbi:MAG: FmdE family protein [Desulfobulbaceae bacterium]|nr:FmdE family protein [Desulfobulbaceae bacterium]